MRTHFGLPTNPYLESKSYIGLCRNVLCARKVQVGKQKFRNKNSRISNSNYWKIRGLFQEIKFKGFVKFQL